MMNIDDENIQENTIWTLMCIPCSMCASVRVFTMKVEGLAIALERWPGRICRPAFVKTCDQPNSSNLLGKSVPS